jgi:excisionase family DNA binding protein
MAKSMFSAEEVADILGLHVRTVRGYVRDGRLPATRIGKQYRIARSDLDAFTGARPSPPADGADETLRVDASAVVQVEPIGPAAMTRLTTLVTAATGTREDGEGQLHVHTAYDARRAALKIIVVGTADDIAKVLTLVSALTREQA